MSSPRRRSRSRQGTIPFLDVRADYRALRRDLDDAYFRVMNSGQYVHGQELDAFEREFAAFCGTRHAIGVGNGLDALTIALRARDVGPGDEVIVPAHTFIATWLAVQRVGAAIVPVDVEPDSLLIDLEAAASAVTSRTAAIIPVHLYGQAADMTTLDRLAERHGLLVLGDAAQAHGAAHRGRNVGELGDIAAFSFYPAKNLGGFGDGGALTTDDDALAARAARLRNYGAADHHEFAEFGLNSRLDSLQAAFLRVKLQALPEWNRRRAAVARTYLSGLSDLPELILPKWPASGDESVWHLFCVRHPRRDALSAHLNGLGVHTHVHYRVPPHRSEAFVRLDFADGAFPVTEAAAASLLSLPIGPHLSDFDVEAVVDAARSFSAQL